MKVANPFAFKPGPVSFWTTIVYLALIISLIFVHEIVPPAPAPGDWPQGVNLTEAWLDLQTITGSYHPYNSHDNDVVRDFLLLRAREILHRNRVPYTTDLTGGVPWRSSHFSVGAEGKHKTSEAEASHQQRATIFDDLVSNVTYATRESTVGQYFEGMNIYVYIQGSEDPEGDWWRREDAERLAKRGAGVLVNCHFDSVSTGFGATDDGAACVSMLQLLSHFTSEGRQPRNGIVLLFNNGEEDGLLGARAFGYSPLVQFCHTFVNLEGAGAGGRALLFRTTDLETAQAYSKTPHPLGSVVAANAFERGVIRSGTDFTVFVENFGLRGLDIAFYAPRSRYHTAEDDARHTSVDSIWHMLSAALASTSSLAETTGSRFSGPRSDHRKDLVQNGRPTSGVWFDWLGSAWSAFPLRGLFAWTLTLLITTPLILILVTFLLARSHKWYFFASSVESDDDDDDGGGAESPVSIGGWKGFIRFPVALIGAGGSTIAVVYLLAKVNPLIIYSSNYAVWAMMLSLFYFKSWLLLRGAHLVRPSALQRGFTLIWLFILTWVLSIFAAVAEDRMNLGGVYALAFLHSLVFGAVLISLLEQFGLPRKERLSRQLAEADAGDSGDSSEDEDGSAEQPGREDGGAEHEAAPTETTPLRAGGDGYGSAEQQTTTFASTYRRSVSGPRDGPRKGKGSASSPFEDEQSWSVHLPSWTWLFQFLLLAVVYVIVLGNLALVQTSSLSMTGTDGSSVLVPIMGVGILTMMLLLPLTPFIHRVSYHVPVFLLLVFIVTLIYNLVAFPFSVNSRFKFFFQQVIDVDEGTNIVSLAGLEQYIRPVIASLPTAAGQEIECVGSTVRSDVRACQYNASLLPPDVANGAKPEDLVSIEASRTGDGKSVTVRIDALNTRTCFLDTSFPIFGFSVEGGARRDERFGSLPPDGLGHVQLWRRKWEGQWNVTLQPGRKSHETAEARIGGDGELELRDTSLAAELSVTARCAWSDVNEHKNIPAFHEVRTYVPTWAVVTKASVGLLEVKKTIRVP